MTVPIRMSLPSESGSKYLIYYTEGAGATTDVPVISGKSYTISGTNEGGFVTVVSLDGHSSAVTSSSDDTSEVTAARAAVLLMQRQMSLEAQKVQKAQMPYPAERI